MSWISISISQRPDFKLLKRIIEKNTKLSVKVLKYGYAIAVVDKKALNAWGKYEFSHINKLSIVYWRHSDKELLLRVVDESDCPKIVDVPLKYVSRECVATKNNELAVNWRDQVKAFHNNNKEKLAWIMNLRPGEKVFVDEHLVGIVSGKYSKKRLPVLCFGKVYRLKSSQIHKAGER